MGPEGKVRHHNIVLFKVYKNMGFLQDTKKGFLRHVFPFKFCGFYKVREAKISSVFSELQIYTLSI